MRRTRYTVAAVAAGLAGLAAFGVPRVRAQVSGYVWQIAGVTKTPVRTINIASGGAFNSTTGTVTITAGGGGGASNTTLAFSPASAAAGGGPVLNVSSGGGVATGLEFEANLASTIGGWRFYQGNPASSNPYRVRVWKYTYTTGNFSPVVISDGTHCAAADPLYCVDVPNVGAGVYSATFAAPVHVAAYSESLIALVWDTSGNSYATSLPANLWVPGVASIFNSWGPALLYYRSLRSWPGDAVSTLTSAAFGGSLGNNPAAFAAQEPVISSVP